MSTLRDRLLAGTATPEEQREAVYLIDLIKIMRDSQKRYFARPVKETLFDAKQAESNADGVLKVFYNSQGGLFE